jgi:hypothetical protein
MKIPSGVTIIDDYAFYKCKSLKSIKIPEGETLVGVNTFNECISLNKTDISKLVFKLEGKLNTKQNLNLKQIFGNRIASRDPEIRLKLDEDTVAMRIDEKADNVKKSICYAVDANYYTLLTRDNVYLGMPLPYGGLMYPLSEVVTKRPLVFEKKYKSFSILTVSRDFHLKLNWGTEKAYTMMFENRKFEIGFAGKLYFTTLDFANPYDLDKFLNALSLIKEKKQGMYTVEDFGNILLEDVREICRKTIYMFVKKYGSDGIVGMPPSEILKISQEVYFPVSVILKNYGLKLVDENSIVTNILCRPKFNEE